MEPVPNHAENEPSSRHAAIPVDGIVERYPILENKLTEYNDRLRAKGEDFAFMSPGQLAQLYPQELASVFKPVTLQVLLDTARAKEAGEDINLTEVALKVSDITGLDVNLAATIPFIKRGNSQRMPDYKQLPQDSPPEVEIFLDVYTILRGYAIGDMRGITGGTGLREA